MANAVASSSLAFNLPYIEKLFPLGATVVALKNIVQNSIALGKRRSYKLLNDTKFYWSNLVRDIFRFISGVLAAMPLYFALAGVVSVVGVVVAATISSVLASVQFIWQMVAEAIALTRARRSIRRLEEALAFPTSQEQVTRGLEEYQELRAKRQRRIDLETDENVRKLLEEDAARELDNRFGVRGSSCLRCAYQAATLQESVTHLREVRDALKSRIATHCIEVASAVAFLGALILGFFTGVPLLISYALWSAATLLYGTNLIRFYARLP